MRENIDSNKDLRVFNEAFILAIEIFKLTKKFPPEEKYSLTDQVRRSSRSVCLNIGEEWRKRRYPKSFASKLSDGEAEACETQVSLLLAKEFGYISPEIVNEFEMKYENVIRMLVNMNNHPEKWKV